MKLPNYRRINVIDFTSEQQPLVEKLASNLNIGFDNVYLALNNRLTFSENFNGTQKTFTTTLDSSGAPKQAISLQLNTAINNQPRASGTQIINAVNNTDSSVYPTGSPFISFTQSGNSIAINHIAGLPSDNEFEITVLIYHA